MQPSGGGGGGGGSSAGADQHAMGEFLAAGGSLLKGIGGYEAGKFNAKADRFNQTIARSDNVAQQQQVRDAARAAMGEQVASQGESGTVIGVGSNLDALHQSAINAQLDALELRRKGSVQSTGYDIKTFNDKSAGAAAFTGGLFDAGSAFAHGLGDYAAAGS